jgi:site-specific DNA-cytosine methylase
VSEARIYKVVTLFAGIGGKTLGLKRSRSRAGSSFRSVGAFDIDALACRDFERLTGSKCQQVDIGIISPAELAALCEEAPDVVVMSPPCTGYSGCLADGLSKTDKYQALNLLALRAINLALETWDTKPSLILLENVIGMLSRGADILAQIKALLWHAGYDVDMRLHDCGEIGALAQSRTRILLVARLRTACPSHLMMPPKLGLQPMSSVLWKLPVPLPIPRHTKGTKKRDHVEAWLRERGGPLHRLPQLAPINWLRLAAIPAGRDWRWIPAAIRLPEDGKRHAGKYGVQRDDQPSHTVLAETRTGKGWADVADPRVGKRKTRQNGGFGVNDAAMPAHAVLGERGVHNTWGSVCDPRSECERRDNALGVSDPSRPYKTAVIGSQQIHNNPSSIADPRVGGKGKGRQSGLYGVNDPADPSHAVLGSAKAGNSSWSSVTDPRLEHEPRRGTFGVQDPAHPSVTIRGAHSVRQAPSAVADGRGLFRPDWDLRSPSLTTPKAAWINGKFELLGPSVEIKAKGGACWMIIRAPDGTVHRPMTTLELAALQGFPVWHRVGDPAPMEIGEDGGGWLELAGADSLARKHIGNAMPIDTAEKFGNEALELLDLGTTWSFKLDTRDIWVREGAELLSV